MRPVALYLVLLALGAPSAACSLFSTSPAVHSPLKERLAAADTPTVEDAAKACFRKGGWKVDPVGGMVEGANVVTASNAKMKVDLYVQAAEVKPRVTGGPDYGDPFWNCLGKQLASGAPAASDSADDQPPPEDKPDDKPADKSEDKSDDKAPAPPKPNVPSAD
ncbi:MAG TPA: hypothetical protein VGM06_16555 [Polyangiaceae bacterium]